MPEDQSLMFNALAQHLLQMETTEGKKMQGALQIRHSVRGELVLSGYRRSWMNIVYAKTFATPKSD